MFLNTISNESRYSTDMNCEDKTGEGKMQCSIPRSPVGERSGACVLHCSAAPASGMVWKGEACFGQTIFLKSASGWSYDAESPCVWVVVVPGGVEA